jgi:hypothetical protein
MHASLMGGTGEQLYPAEERTFDSAFVYWFLIFDEKMPSFP